jgi:hypothetical protein
MSKRFRNGSMQFASAVMLAAVLAGVVCVATSGLANETKFATTSVDRMPNLTLFSYGAYFK